MTACTIVALSLLCAALIVGGLVGEYANAETRAVIAQLGDHQLPAPGGDTPGPARGEGEAPTAGSGAHHDRWWPR